MSWTEIAMFITLFLYVLGKELEQACWLGVFKYGNPQYFDSELSWKNKYKVYIDGKIMLDGNNNPIPRFWQSDGLLVSVTDGEHLFQFFSNLFLAITFLLFTPSVSFMFTPLLLGVAIFLYHGIYDKMLKRFFEN